MVSKNQPVTHKIKKNKTPILLCCMCVQQRHLNQFNIIRIKIPNDVCIK